MIARLGGANDPASISADAPLGTLCSIAHLVSGDFVVGDLVGGGQLAVYGSDGMWLRAVGRPGQGPTEFGNQLGLTVMHGDTLEVFDRFNQRAVTVTAEGRFLGSFRLPGGGSGWSRLGGGRWLLTTEPAASDNERPLFRVLDDAGTRIAQFGTHNHQFGDLDWWTVAGGRHGDLWTASVWRYEIYHWSDAGEVEGSYARHAAWFPDRQEVTPGRLERMYTDLPPLVYLEHLTEGTDRRLWTFSVVPDAHWSPDSLHFSSPAWTRRTFDTVVEVLDVSHGSRVRVMARH